MENNTHNTSSVPGRVNDPQTLARFASIKSYDDYVKDKNNPVVMVTLTLGDQPFLNKNHFETFLTQHTNAHDEFTIVVSDTAIDDFYGQVMKNSKNLLGEKITIHFHQKGNIIQSFKGIIANICNKKNEGGGYGNLYISGFAPSILLDSGKECQSYENKTLKEIVAQATEEYKEVTINTDGLLNTKYQIPYVVQYKESDYQFIQRLARRYGEFFYYNGTQLMFNNETQKTVTLLEGGDLINVEFELMIKPQNFSYISYDVETGNTEQKTTQEVHLQDKINPFQYAAIKASEKVFTKKPTIPYNAISEQFRGDYLKDVVRREKESREQLMQVRGKSRNPHLRIGGFIKLKDINDKPMESYRIIDIKHHQSGYDYENEFIAIPDVYIAYYYDEQALPRAEQQVARVTDNNDPKGLGRVRVQFIWQEKHQTKTPWIRVVQPHAGGGKGFYFIPEIGEEVWVDFEDQNAERPFVVGSNYNGKEYSPFHNTNNDIKAIQTRSGVKIKIDDSNGSLFLEDPSGNNIYMDGKQKISFNGATLEFNAQRIIMNATERTEITTNDYILNALSKIYVFSTWFKQQINGFMHLFSNSALINTTNAIDIEAKEAKLLGTEKSIVHSDNVAVVNSLGTAELKGKQGNKYTQKAEEVSSTPAEEIGLAVVHFRPLDTWRGEFGFDWLRIDDGVTFTKEKPYEEIIEGGYTDEKTDDGKDKDLSKTEAYEKLKKEYEIHPIKRQENSNLSNHTEYFVPYLTMFSEKFVNKLPNNLLVKPVFKVKLKILLEIEEDLNDLKFEYSEKHFKINRETFPTGKTSLSDGGEIEITCIRDIDEDTYIDVYAYPKSNSSIEGRKLAGRIIVLKNNNKARKEENIVLVKVSTCVKKNTLTDFKEGIFDPREEKALYHSLYQSLIIPNIEQTALDLAFSSDKEDFQEGGSFISVNGKLTIYFLKNIRTLKVGIDTKLFSKVKRIFINKEDDKGDRVNAKYKNYFTVFKFGIDAETIENNTEILYGMAQDIGIRNAFIFPTTTIFTIAHEVLHGLGLSHTHRDNIPLKGTEDNEGNEIGHKYKYIYPCAIKNSLQSVAKEAESTTNIMSYNSNTFSSWRWQWIIINPNLKTKWEKQLY